MSIIFNAQCLRYVFEPVTASCTVNDECADKRFSVPLFRIRAVGCLQYIVTFPIRTRDRLQSSFRSCTDTCCIDKVIGFTSRQFELHPSLIQARCVSVTRQICGVDCGENQIITSRIQFILPLEPTGSGGFCPEKCDS